MNDIIRRTIKEGVDPAEAIQMATINPATWLGLSELGVLAPGKLADIAVVEGELADMNVSEVFLSGQLCSKRPAAAASTAGLSVSGYCKAFR